MCGAAAACVYRVFQNGRYPDISLNKFKVSNSKYSHYELQTKKVQPRLNRIILKWKAQND